MAALYRYAYRVRSNAERRGKYENNFEWYFFGFVSLSHAAIRIPIIMRRGWAFNCEWATASPKAYSHTIIFLGIQWGGLVAFALWLSKNSVFILKKKKQFLRSSLWFGKSGVCAREGLNLAQSIHTLIEWIELIVNNRCIHLFTNSKRFVNGPCVCVLCGDISFYSIFKLLISLYSARSHTFLVGCFAFVFSYLSITVVVISTTLFIFL